MADLSGLLDEISADSPCGENLEYDSARVALDTNIQGTPENQFTGEKAQPPNWRDIEKQAISLLQKSKDLQVVLYLIRALTNSEGWIGFRDGLSFLDEILRTYWDFLHPQLDPEDGLDPTMRINILEELANFELLLRPLSLAMLVESKAVGRFCLRDIQYATDKFEPPEGSTKPDIGVIRAAFLDVDSGTLKASYQAVVDSLCIVDQLEEFVSEKAGAGQAADLSPLKSLLKEVRYHFEQFAGASLAGDTGAATDEADLEVVGDDARPVKIKAATGSIDTRQDVLRMLDLLCQYYSEYEPSSPVPILLRRAKHLVTADFMEIVQNLMPDGLSQIEMIKGPDPDAD